MERFKLIKGIYRDILTDPNNQVLYDSGWHSNVIVDNGRVLLAGLMKNDTFTGIKYLAVGSGEDSWDAHSTPPPPTATELVSPHTPAIQAGDMSLDYLDDQDNIVAGPTTRLQITATLAPSYPPPPNSSHLKTYPLREFGLFGLFDSNTAYMINNVRHPVIHKDESATLTRIIRLSF